MSRSAYFGHPDAHGEGAYFSDRRALHDAHIHGPLQQGIDGRQDEGAFSIVLSGGYADDEDFGDVIIYTGHGGQENKRQVEDQKNERGNRALIRNFQRNLPVRVIRGAKHRSEHSPGSGYEYCGVFFVESYDYVSSVHGPKVFKFRLRKEGSSNAGPDRKEATTSRIIRDTRLAIEVKKIHAFKCQVCNELLDTPDGPYAEGAHIRPLGRPHNGPDAIENILCLCPNHHLLFDRLSFSINDNGSLLGLIGHLNVVDEHQLNLDHFQYHRGLFKDKAAQASHS